MTKEREPAQPHARELLPFQAEFVESFTRPGSAPHHLLIGPPGTGKTVVTAHILARLRDAQPGRRILVLTPGPLLEHQGSVLCETMGAEDVQIIDRRRYRELEADTPVGSPLWPDDVVAVMSVDFAKQDDISDALGMVEWDLVVIDESHTLTGRRADLLRRLLQSKKVKRLLLVTADSSAPPPDWLPQLSTTNWRPIVDRLLSERRASVNREVVAVSYTRQEIVVFEKLGQFLAQLAATSAAALLQQTLLSRARSSFYALEASLLRLRLQLTSQSGNEVLEMAFRQALAEGVAPEEFWNEFLNEFSQVEAEASTAASAAQSGTGAGWHEQIRDLDTMVARLDDLVAGLEGVDTDSKLGVLLKLLQDRKTTEGELFTVALSNHAATVVYLRSALSDRGFKTVGLTGSVPLSERVELLGQAVASGGLLLATPTVLEGMDVRPAASCIFYDVPPNPDRVEQAIARMGSLGRDRSLDVFLFDDTAQAELHQLFARL